MIINTRLTTHSPELCSIEIRERLETGPSTATGCDLGEADCRVSEWSEVWRGRPSEAQPIFDFYLQVMRSGRVSPSLLEGLRDVRRRQ
jgi:hypothetical protein